MLPTGGEHLGSPPPPPHREGDFPIFSDPVEAIMCSGPAGLILSISELTNQCFILMKRNSSCQLQKFSKRAHECIFEITKSIRAPCQ